MFVSFSEDSDLGLAQMNNYSVVMAVAMIAAQADANMVFGIRLLRQCSHGQAGRQHQKPRQLASDVLRSHTGLAHAALTRHPSATAKARQVWRSVEARNDSLNRADNCSRLSSI